MIFRVRPSKTFLYNYIARILAEKNKGIGLDAASAGFKNRFMFKTDQYYGLDINLESLKNSVKKDESNNTFAIYADLARLDKLPSDSIDVVVSTNTLYVLQLEDRLRAVSHLCRLAVSSATAIIELPLDGDVEKSVDIISNNFKDVKIVYYGNIISRAYEGFFEKDGFLGSHPFAGKKSFLAFAWLISQLEYLTCKISLGNKHVLVVACDKKSDADRAKFDLSYLPMIDGKIYNAQGED